MSLLSGNWIPGMPVAARDTGFVLLKSMPQKNTDRQQLKRDLIIFEVTQYFFQL